MVNPAPLVQVASPPETAALSLAMPIEVLKEQLRNIQQFQQDVMVKGEDYDTIPGTKKPSLMNPGAEKLAMLFSLAPRYEPTFTHHEDSHLTVLTKCFLYHRVTAQLWGEGIGSCTSKESKYAWRQGRRKCPSCGAEAILKSKKKPGWYCNGNADGCWQEYAPGDKRIEGQEIGRIPNPDIHDTHNTVLKMSMKRAFVGGIRTATAAGHLFTQDLEDGERYDGDGPAGDYDDAAQNVDPRAFFEQIEASADEGMLRAVGLAIAETQLHPQDRHELQSAYYAKLKKHRGQAGNGQKSVMDRIVEQQGGGAPSNAPKR